MSKLLKPMIFLQSCYINIKGYLFKKTNLIFVVYSIVVISIGTFIYSESGKMSKRSIEEQLLHRQTIMIRMGAKRINDYFRRKEEGLSFLASLSAVKNNYLGNAIDEVLIEDVRNSTPPLSGVIRVDNNGIILSTTPGLLSEPRVNIADRDYYIWSKDPQNKGNIFYSGVFKSRGGLLKGKDIIIMATPIWIGEEFKGLVAYTISVEELANVFVKDMSLSNYSSPFLIDFNGVMLYHDIVGLRSINLFEYTDSYHWKGKDQFISALKKMILGEEVKTSYYLREPDGRVLRRIVASTPVGLADGKINWTLGIALTDKDTNIFLKPIYQTHVWILVYFIISTLGLVFIGIYISKIRSKNAFLEGFKEGRKN